MGIASNSGFAEGISEDNICGFSADAGQFYENIHRIRYFAIELSSYYCAGCFYIAGFVPEEAGRFDVRFELFDAGVCPVIGRFVFFEEVFGYYINPDIGALGRKYCRD